MGMTAFFELANDLIRSFAIKCYLFRNMGGFYYSFLLTLTQLLLLAREGG